MCTTISIELFERSEGELYPNELHWFAARAFGSRSATGPSWAPCLRRRKRLSSGALQHGSTIYHRLGRHATPAKLISQNNPTQQADRLSCSAKLPALTRISTVATGQVPSDRKHLGLLDPEHEARIGTGIGKADASPAHFAHARLARLADRDEQRIGPSQLRVEINEALQGAVP